MVLCQTSFIGDFLLKFYMLIMETETLKDEDEEMEVCPALPQEGTGASLCSPLSPCASSAWLFPCVLTTQKPVTPPSDWLPSIPCFFASRLLLNIFVNSHLERLCCLEGLVLIWGAGDRHWATGMLAKCSHPECPPVPVAEWGLSVHAVTDWL